jgi:hypothetical protein
MAGCQAAPHVSHGMRRPYAPTSWARAMRAARQRRQNNDTPKGFQDKTAGAPDEPAGQSCRYAAFVYPPNDAINATCVGMDTTVRVCANNDDEAQEIADVSACSPGRRTDFHMHPNKLHMRVFFRKRTSCFDKRLVSSCCRSVEYGAEDDSAGEDYTWLRSVLLEFLLFNNWACPAPASGENHRQTHCLDSCMSTMLPRFAKKDEPFML